jgi:hypothetical protein
MKLFLLYEKVVKGLKDRVEFFLHLFFEKCAQSISAMRGFRIIITDYSINLVVVLSMIYMGRENNLLLL